MAILLTKIRQHLAANGPWGPLIVACLAVVGLCIALLFGPRETTASADDLGWEQGSGGLLLLLDAPQQLLKNLLEQLESRSMRSGTPSGEDEQRRPGNDFDDDGRSGSNDGDNNGRGDNGGSEDDGNSGDNGAGDSENESSTDDEQSTSEDDNDPVTDLTPDLPKPDVPDPLVPEPDIQKPVIPEPDVQLPVIPKPEIPAPQTPDPVTVPEPIKPSDLASGLGPSDPS